MRAGRGEASKGHNKGKGKNRKAVGLERVMRHEGMGRGKRGGKELYGRQWAGWAGRRKGTQEW